MTSDAHRRKSSVAVLSGLKRHEEREKIRSSRERDQRGPQMRRLAIVAAALVVALSSASAALAAAALKGSYFANNRTGTYELTFAPRYYVENVTYHAGGFAYGEGKYSVNGRTLTLFTGEVAGRVPCNGKYKGVYTFKLTGNTLTFKLVSDKCTARHSVFRLTFAKQQMG